MMPPSWITAVPPVAADQLGDQLVAPIEQVGRGGGDVGADRTVDLRDLLRQAVDLGGTGQQGRC